MRQHIAATNRFACTREFLWKSLLLQQNFVTATSSTDSVWFDFLRLVAATKFCWGDKDFHKTSPDTWSDLSWFVAATCLSPHRANVAIRWNRWKRTFSMAKYSVMTKLDIYFWNSIDVKTSFSLLKDTNSVTHISVYWGNWQRYKILSFHEVEVLILSQLFRLLLPQGSPSYGLAVRFENK